MSIDDKDTREHIHQYNLKHTLDIPAPTTNNNSFLPPKRPTLPSPDVKLLQILNDVIIDDDNEHVIDDITSYFLENNINIDDYSDTDDKMEQTDFVYPNVSAVNVLHDHICPNLETPIISVVDVSPLCDQYDPCSDDLKNINRFYDRQECLVALPFSAFTTTYPNILCPLDGGANAFIFNKRE